MDEQMKVGIGADITNFTRKMKRVTKAIKNIPKNTTKKISLNVDDFNKNIDTLANRIRSVGTVAGSVFKGGLLATLPMLSPLIASLSGGIGGLVTSFAAAGSGAVMFASVATSALNDVFSVNSDIKDLREKLANTTDLKKRAELNEQIAQAVASLSKEQQKGLKALQSFGKFWGKFAKQFQKPVMDIFIRSLGQLKGLIKGLKPAFDGAVSAVDTLSKSLGGAIETKQFQKFIDFLNTNVGPAMTSLGKSFGNVMQGIMNLMVAFAPLSVNMQDGLVGLTKKFAKWTAGLKDSKAFQKFIDYVKTNGPKVMALIGNLTDFLIQLGVGMAPLGAKILTLVNSFLKWTSGMMKANPVIGQVIAWVTSLSGVLLALVPGILFVKSMFGGMAMAIWTKTGMMRAKLVTGVAMMIKSLGQFALKMVTMVGKFVAQAAIFTAKTVATAAKFVAKWAFMGIQALLHAAKVAAAWFIALGPVGWVIATVIGLVALIIANWDKIKKWTVKIWSAVWGFIKDVASKIKNWVKSNFNGVYNFIKSYMKMAESIIKSVWGYIKGSFMNVLTFLKALVQGDFKGMKNAIQDQMQLAKTTISNIWNSIKAFFQGVLMSIWRKVKSKFNKMVGTVREKMNDVWNKIEEIWGNVMDFFKGIDLKQTGKDIIQGLVNGIDEAKDWVYKKVKNVATGIKDTLMFWTDSHSPSKMTEKIGGFVGQGLANGIADKVREVTNAAKKLAKAAIPETPKIDTPMLNASAIGKENEQTKEDAEKLGFLSKFLPLDKVGIVL